MDFLQNFAASTQFPILSAFVLGLMMAISPCPLATNISAIGYISKDLQQRRKIFLNGLLYTLGRAISYTGLGVVLIMLLKQGSSTYAIQKFISTYGGMVIGPLLILIGIGMLGVIKINFSVAGRFSDRAEQKAGKGSLWGSLFLGIVFALAFCPYSGVIYFMALIPLSVSASSGYFLPLVFAIATGLPVIIVAWILAYSVSSIGKVYNRIKVFEQWFRRIVAVVFIVVGAYYCYMVFL